MLRRAFLGVVGGLTLAPVVASGHKHAAPRVGDVAPPTESAWRALPAGTVVERVSVGPRRDYDARWVLIHPSSRNLVGSYRLAWGGAHAGAMPWRPIERRDADHYVVVAVGVADDERAVADAISHRCSEVEREWVLDVWQNRWMPPRGPLTEEELAAVRSAIREMVSRMRS